MQQVDEIVASAKSAITGAKDLSSLDAVRVQYLGKQGELTGVLR